MLEAKNISKVFGSSKLKEEKNKVNAVKGVNFSMMPGEFCALVGESGSGKSTLAQILAGLIAPTSGGVFLDGKSIAPVGHGRSKELCSRIQMVLQDGKSALDPRFTVYESIAEPLMNLMKINKSEEQERVFNLMEKMELSKSLYNRKSYELSGGQQKRVCIARALATEPEIVIFDESLSGLDVLARKRVLELLKHLHKEQKMTYLFITHDMDVALYVANRISVMKNGSIVEERIYQGNVSCFSHPYSKLLLSSMLSTV